jgi:hypothetical protein
MNRAPSTSVNPGLKADLTRHKKPIDGEASYISWGFNQAKFEAQGDPPIIKP